MGDLSAHFSRSEFRCRHCGAGVVSPQLLAILERLRATIGRPLAIRSGFRCVVHNAAVGGAKASRHINGDAADLEAGYATPAQARAAGAVGIGTSGPWAVHVDWRPGPFTTWKY